MKTNKLYLDLWRNDQALKMLLAFIVLPFILISFFNNPATDDFFYTFYADKLTSIGAAKWMYFNNGGRYFSDTLLCFNPIHFGLYWPFKILPIMFIGLFVYSIQYLFKTLDVSSQNKKLSVLFLILYFTLLPDVSMGFYWMPSVITYQFSLILTLLFFAFLLKYFKEKRVAFLLISILFLVMILGTNQIIPLYIILILLLVLIVKKLNENRLDKVVLFLILLTILFTAFEILAPGNFNRLSNVKGEHLLLNSIFKSLKFTIDCLLKWTPIVLIFNLFILKQTNNYLLNKRFTSYLINPIYAFILLLLILILGSFPVFWLTNTNSIPSRVTNLVFFFYLISMQYFIFCSLFHLNNKLDFKLKINKSLTHIMFLLIMLFSFLNTSSYIAYLDLSTLKAYGYNKEIQSRFILLNTSNKDTIYIQSLTKKPITIYHEEVMGLTNNPKNWKNEELHDYFKKVIIIKPLDSTLTE